MKAAQRLVPLPVDALHAAVSWGQEETPATGTLFLVAAPGADGIQRLHAVDLASGKAREVHAFSQKVLALAVEPGFNGSDRLLALVRHEKLLRGYAWDLSRDKPEAAALFRFDLAFETAPSPDALVEAAPLDDGRDFALLFRAPKGGWLIRTPETSKPHPAQVDPGPPRLVTTPRDGLFLVFAHPERSFVPIGDPPPEKH